MCTLDGSTYGERDGSECALQFTEFTNDGKHISRMFVSSFVTDSSESNIKCLIAGLYEFNNSITNVNWILRVLHHEFSQLPDQNEQKTEIESHNGPINYSGAAFRRLSSLIFSNCVSTALSLLSSAKNQKSMSIAMDEVVSAICNHFYDLIFSLGVNLVQM